VLGKRHVVSCIDMIETGTVKALVYFLWEKGFL